MPSSFYNSASERIGVWSTNGSERSGFLFFVSPVEKLLEHGLTIEDLNPVNVENRCCSRGVSGNGILATLIPYLLLIYIFAGAMNIGLDTTAGEKERNMPVLLVNQVSRSSIATGKILYM